MSEIEKNIVYEDTLVEITPELMKKTIVEQDKEIERLHSIIKEVREYIELQNNYGIGNIVKNELLKILDKVGDIK